VPSGAYIKHILQTSEPLKFSRLDSYSRQCCTIGSFSTTAKTLSKKYYESLQNSKKHAAGLNTVEEKHEHNLSHYFAFAFMYTSTRSLVVAVIADRTACRSAAAALYDRPKINSLLHDLSA